jgi:hypothetical protein
MFRDNLDHSSSPSRTAPTVYYVDELNFPPIGPGYESISEELNDRLSKAIGVFSGSAYDRLAPGKPASEEEDPTTPTAPKGKEEK